MAICPGCRSQGELCKECPTCRRYFVEESQWRKSPSDELLGTLIGGQYIPTALIGEGGMGRIYKARAKYTGQTVALKILKSEYMEDETLKDRFFREAEVVGALDHPHIVKLYGCAPVPEHNTIYMAMELLNGRTLFEVLRREVTPLQTMMLWFTEIASALGCAHSKGIFHRDLKPENVFIIKEDDGTEHVKVLDFGLAALTDRAKITMSGQALGTPWYMSPEQATASAVSFSSDIYSLGCILYELATSKPPFPGNRPFNVMMQHVNAQVPPMITRPEAEISADMVGFILRCLEKQPQNRYQTANEALSALYMLPEWMVDGQSTPSQSLLQSMRQLSQLSDIRSDISSSITGILRSGEMRSVGSRPSGAISSNSGEIIVRSDEISVRSGEVISRPSDPAVRSGRSFSLNIQGLTESGSHPRQSRQFHSESIVQSLISSSPENPKVNSQELAYISDPDGRLASMESFVGEKFKFIVAIAVVIIAALIVAIIYLATRGA